jgi:hypothetical protein
MMTLSEQRESASTQFDHCHRQRKVFMLRTSIPCGRSNEETTPSPWSYEEADRGT